MSADVSLTIRYAALSGPKVGHLLPRTVPKGRRKGRPSLCGIWRQQWRPVERTDDPHAYTPCAGCSTEAGIRPAPPKPLNTAPRTRRRPAHRDDVVSVRAQLLDPQQATAALPARHRIFRGPNPFGFAFTGEAAAYASRRYEQRLAPAHLID